MSNFDFFTKRFLEAKVLEQNEKLLFIEISDLKLLVAVGVLMENGFSRLISLGGADYQDRMEGIYHFGRYDGKPDVIALKMKIPRSEPVLPSIVKLIPGANWHERETYDLFGIRFEGHPNLERIFLPKDFPGFPLRKDWHGEDTVPLLFGDESGEAPTNLVERKI